MKLNRNTILVTGRATGIGLAIDEAFVKGARSSSVGERKIPCARQKRGCPGCTPGNAMWPAKRSGQTISACPWTRLSHPAMKGFADNEYEIRVQGPDLPVIR